MSRNIPKDFLLNQSITFFAALELLPEGIPLRLFLLSLIPTSSNLEVLALACCADVLLNESTIILNAFLLVPLLLLLNSSTKLLSSTRLVVSDVASVGTSLVAVCNDCCNKCEGFCGFVMPLAGARVLLMLLVPMYLNIFSVDGTLL